MTELFTISGTPLPNPEPPDNVSKAAFAAEMGLAKSRVSQLIELGMPVTANGMIHRETALAWYDRTIDPHRRKALLAPEHSSPKARLDAIRAEREQLELDRMRGELIDRRKAEAAIFELARAERDSLLSWTARIAPVIAAEIAADPAALFAALDREARRHLAELAADPMPGLGDG